VAPKPTGGYSFDELEKEVRRYLSDVAHEGDVSQALKEIQAAAEKVRKITKSITRASLTRAAKAGFEISGGVVREPAASDPHQAPDARPLLTGDEGESQKAHSVQANLLPSAPPSLPGFDIAALYRFCHEVGGDYFDFIPLPDGRTALVVADASGKGVPAAMVMVMLRSILRLVAANAHDPVETLVHTNRLLMPDMLRGMFVTALYVVIDPVAREMVLVNAGHYPPIIWRPRLSGTRVVNIRGPALGLLDTQRFAANISRKTLALEPGDCLCFYTDGVPEAKNLLGEEFGERRLARAFRDHATQPAQKIVDAIVAAVDAHSEETPQHDDITVLAMRVL